MEREEVARLIRDMLLERSEVLHVDAADAGRGHLGVALADGTVFSLSIGELAVLS